MKLGKKALVVQPTGGYPIEVNFDYSIDVFKPIEKRAVSASLLVSADELWYTLTLSSEWVDEWPMTMVGGPFAWGRDGMDLLCHSFKTDAKSLLAPGAGYPGTPEYEGRQAKLAGQIETTAISCLTSALMTLYVNEG